MATTQRYLHLAGVVFRDEAAVHSALAVPRYRTCAARLAASVRPVAVRFVAFPISLSEW
jgi:hypothetical protein